MDTIETEVTKALEEPTQPLKGHLRNEFRNRIEARPSQDTEITVYADVRSGAQREIIQVAKWRAVDLYAYSDAPIIDFLNAVGEIAVRTKTLENIPAGDIEFEHATIKLWQEVRNLSRFGVISPQHSELISAFYTLTIGQNALLTQAKINALRTAISLIQDNIGLADEVLDQIEDLLEAADFDLNIAMALAGPDGEEQVGG